MNDIPAADADPHLGRTRNCDDGLFGPVSVTWRVHADPLMGVAGLRALLLQALHPVAMEAVATHSTYQTDPWGRLMRIAQYIGVITFGSTAEAMLAASRVRAVHARSAGYVSEGVSYQADDPQLLGWMHCCSVASYLELVTRGGLRLTGAEQDAYIAEQMRAGMLIGLEPDEVPHDRAGLQDYFRAIRPALECSPEARRAAAVVIEPLRPARHSSISLPRPAWSNVAGLAFAALPPWARRLYAFAELPPAAALTDAATTVGLQSLRAALTDAQAVTPDGQDPQLRAAR